MERICVIFNPRAGRRRAARRLEAFRQQWQGRADFWTTESAGHAEVLAGRAAALGYRTIAAAGGDGTVHEVVGGLLRAESQDATFAIVPIGSANDYAFTMERQFGAFSLDDRHADPVDAGLLRLPGGVERYFVEGVGIGLTAEVTVESRRIPHRQGLWLYGTAALRVLRRGQPPFPLRLSYDDEAPVETATRLLSVLLGQREGNVVMAKHALINDGRFDVVHGGAVGHWEALALLPRFLLWGPPTNHPHITVRRCRRLHVESPEPLTIHADGEVVATRDDAVHGVTLEVLPLRLRVKVCRL
ncbi:MAG: diacylglycerol kinase family protein [Planctomycetaceae bacterium]